MASIFDFNTLAPGAPFPKDKLVPFPEEVDVTIKTRGARAYPKDRDERKQIMDVVVAWLKTALVEAHHMKEVKEAAVKILQRDILTRNLMVNKRDSTFDDEDSPHYEKKYFQELHDHAAAEGQKMGTEMAAYFEEEQLGESLGKIQVHNHPDKNGVQREWRSQECFVRLGECEFLKEGLDFEAEYVYIHVLRMVAMAINPDYQKKIAEIALQANGNHRGVPIKGTPRMVNKLKARDDHRIMPDFLKDHHGQKMTYRSGQNIDINRNAVTFQSVASMTHFIELLAAEFDGVARTKNMFAFSLERAEMQLHYRTFMMNMVWPPAEGDYARTFGELAAQARPMWDEYENMVQKDDNFAKCRYQKQIKLARQHLENLAAANDELHFIVESQVLLQKYLDGRKAMHLLYKVVRAETDKALNDDFSGGKERTDYGMSYAEAEAAAVRTGKPSNHKDAGLRGNLQQMCALLDAGADPNKTFMKGSSAMTSAADAGNADCVQALITRGGDINHRRDMDGMTPVCVGAQKGRLMVVQTMIAAGADLNIGTHSGNTAVAIAGKNGFTDCVKILIAAGASVDHEGEFSRTPIEEAMMKGHTDVVEVLYKAMSEDRRQQMKDESFFTRNADEGGFYEVNALEVCRDAGYDDILELLGF